MTPEGMIESITKSLEVWTLQNLANGAIIAGFLALALILGRGYLEDLKRHLSLRVVTEVWDVAADLVADVLLLAALLIGLFVTNPDIGADIKLALPWFPLAMILLGVAAALRLHHGGRTVGTRAWWVACGLVTTACLLNWFGYTFVMEAAGHEWLDLHPSATWEALRTMRSNLNPELTMSTFLWAGPLMLIAFLWVALGGLVSTLRVGAPRPAEKE
jgi:hypothetical protein